MHNQKLKRRSVYLLATLLSFTGCFLGEAAHADDTGFSLKYALSLSTAALDICKAKGFAGSVSVVDAKGVVRVTLRADGAPKVPVAAPLKAATAALFNLAGSDMAAREKADPDFAATIAAHHDLYNDHPGSLPLRQGNVVIGGFAIADVPHDTADACVREAIAQWPVP